MTQRASPGHPAEAGTRLLLDAFAEGDPDEVYRLDGDEIDLRPMVRDAVVLNLPQAPLCRDECLGPDPVRYPATVEDDSKPVDRRWAALSELRFND